MTDFLVEFYHKGDMLLLTLCTAASLYGIALIYSATRWTGGYRSVIVQCVALLIGICLYIALTFVDFHLLVEKGWKWFLTFDIGFILLLLTPLGTDNDSGNLNWLALDKIIPGFPLDLQPNEIVKIPFILLLAWQITRIQERGRDISSLPRDGRPLSLSADLNRMYLERRSLYEAFCDVRINNNRAASDAAAEIIDLWRKRS